MELVEVKKGESAAAQSEDTDDMGIRKGPWTEEEDTILVNYVATHGHGRWNSVARCAGLKRSGKSCRLRWLNYLRPDIRRGNITLQEQILILDLHSRWGNRWSKIAQHLPGRTDNEIKNYWRTRVIKQARQLKCDVNSKQFKDVLRYVWMPRLLERIRPACPAHVSPSQFTSIAQNQKQPDPNPSASAAGALLLHQNGSRSLGSAAEWLNPTYSFCVSGTSSSDSSLVEFQVPLDSGHNESGLCPSLFEQENTSLLLGGGVGGGDSLENLWKDENIWFLRQLCEELEIKDNFFA